MANKKNVCIRVTERDTGKVLGLMTKRKRKKQCWPLTHDRTEAGAWVTGGGAITAVKRNYLKYLEGKYDNPPDITFQHIEL